MVNTHKHTLTHTHIHTHRHTHTAYGPPVLPAFRTIRTSSAHPAQSQGLIKDCPCMDVSRQHHALAQSDPTVLCGAVLSQTALGFLSVWLRPVFSQIASYKSKLL